LEELFCVLYTLPDPVVKHRVFLDEAPVGPLRLGFHFPTPPTPSAAFLQIGLSGGIVYKSCTYTVDDCSPSQNIVCRHYDFRKAYWHKLTCNLFY